MRCPYCGDRRTEVLKTVYRGQSSYRHRRCLYCGSRFSTQERPVRWSRVERKWPGRRPLRKGWGSLRTPALREKCEVETCGVDFKQAGIRRHVDHIVPARLIRRLKAGNPDRRENLQCICATCHGYKLQADHKLCMGNQLGYLEILRTHNFDLARVERALALYGL
jgi:HNH endonuclease